jgi:hypothetical protein
MNEKHPNEDVEIVVLPDETGKKLPIADRKNIQRLIRDKLLLTSKEPYRKVQVEVTRRSDGGPEALVASMLRAYTYTADVVKVNVDTDYNATSVEPLSADG